MQQGSQTTPRVKSVSKTGLQGVKAWEVRCFQWRKAKRLPHWEGEDSKNNGLSKRREQQGHITEGERRREIPFKTGQRQRKDLFLRKLRESEEVEKGKGNNRKAQPTKAIGLRRRAFLNQEFSLTNSTPTPQDLVIDPNDVYQVPEERNRYQSQTLQRRRHQHSNGPTAPPPPPAAALEPTAHFSTSRSTRTAGKAAWTGSKGLVVGLHDEVRDENGDGFWDAKDARLSSGWRGEAGSEEWECLKLKVGGRGWVGSGWIGRQE
ncbi:hypothetical protein HO133_003254 [Letharia lupina]|uniref:Uncharacterized protein n=1 Tax=Letharia lupina TaxID=560253 RepID=A0A8H6CAU1_9LECA|nr:uncharacterized protein HO133_003254 [Letharia lupina]KAF6220123.1 hypothetical protein HO133_003254 [Letharia lupina]